MEEQKKILSGSDFRVCSITQENGGELQWLNQRMEKIRGHRRPRGNKERSSNHHLKQKLGGKEGRNMRF